MCPAWQTSVAGHGRFGATGLYRLPKLDVSPLSDHLGTALPVDDEDFVRASTADMLADIGYAVVAVASGETAMAVLNGSRHIDVLVTDHLVPGMIGTDPARAARLLRPDLRILIMSGYAEVDGIAPDLVRPTKPFRSADLVEGLSNEERERPDGEGRLSTNGKRSPCQTARRSSRLRRPAAAAG